MTKKHKLYTFFVGYDFAAYFSKPSIDMATLGFSEKGVSFKAVRGESMNFGQLVLLILVLIVAIGCNPPRTRKGGSSQLNTPLPANGGSILSVPEETNPEEERSENPPPPLPPSENPEYRRCGLYNTYNFFGPHIGSYNICQDSNDDRNVGIKIRDLDGQNRICVIPLTSGLGGQTYVGEFLCFMNTQRDRVFEMRFLKNRPGYALASIIGVMIMKDRSYFFPGPYANGVGATLPAPNAYLDCMDFLAATSNRSLCDAFLAVHDRLAKGIYTLHLF